MWPRWLTDPNGVLLVAEVAGQPVALAHVQRVSRREAWLEGLRVHPDHRRRGLADALNTACCAWARAGGAAVARLAIEVDNAPPQRQVEALGWSACAEWLYLVDRKVSPPPSSTARPRLATADDLPAIVARWDRSPLRGPAADLFAVGWTWRRMGSEDVVAAVLADLALVAEGGWVLLQLEDAGPLRLAWLEAEPEAARELVAGARRLAAERGPEPMTAMLPAEPALQMTCTRLGLEVEAWLRVYELEL